MRVDPRAGSRLYYKPLRRCGVPARLEDCPLVGGGFADVDFDGRYVGADVRVGIEIKKVNEILGELGGQRRFALPFEGQLAGLLRTYSPGHIYLIIEGYTRVDRRSGLLLLNGRDAGFGRSRFLFSKYHRFLQTVRQDGGITIIETCSFEETLHWIEAVYGWYQKDEHKSLLSVPAATSDRAIMARVTPVRKVAAQIPDIGWKRSAVAEAAFRTVEEMATADLATWAELATVNRRGVNVRIGRIRAKRIVEFLQRRPKVSASWKRD